MLKKLLCIFCAAAVAVCMACTAAAYPEPRLLNYANEQLEGINLFGTQTSAAFATFAEQDNVPVDDWYVVTSTIKDSDGNYYPYIIPSYSVTYRSGNWGCGISQKSLIKIYRDTVLTYGGQVLSVPDNASYWATHDFMYFVPYVIRANGVEIIDCRYLYEDEVTFYSSGLCSFSGIGASLRQPCFPPDTFTSFLRSRYLTNAEFQAWGLNFSLSPDDGSDDPPFEPEETYENNDSSIFPPLTPPAGAPDISNWLTWLKSAAEAVSGFFSTVFSFLPPELLWLICSGIVLSVVIGIAKMLL